MFLFKYQGGKSKKSPDRVDALTRKRVYNQNILPSPLAQPNQKRICRIDQDSGRRKPVFLQEHIGHEVQHVKNKDSAPSARTPNKPDCQTASFVIH
jgi:hypothetical protein